MTDQVSDYDFAVVLLDRLDRIFFSEFKIIISHADDARALHMLTSSLCKPDVIRGRR